MKLRQKLAVVLASAMIVTAVPVVTSAASTNSVTKTVKVAVNDKLTDVATAPQLKVNLNDYSKQAGEVFYLQLENSKWLTNAASAIQAAIGETGVTVTRISDTELKVAVQKDTNLSDTTFTMPLLTEVVSGDAKVSIVNKGNTTVSEQSFVFATTSSKLAEVTVGSTIPKFYKSGKIADIIITEAFQGALSTAQAKVEITLQNDDFMFVNGTGTVELAYGFAGTGNTQPSMTAIASVSTKDDQVLTVTLPQNLKTDSIGQIVLKGIEVRSTVKAPRTGDVTVDIAGEKITAKSDVKVATVTEYGNALTVKDDKAVEIVAGQSKEVTFTLAENVEDSMISGREVEFTLDKGYLALEDKTKTATITNLTKNLTVKNDSAAVTPDITDVNVKDGKVIGFTMKMPAQTSVDKFNFTTKVFLGLEESGQVKLKAEGRAINEELSVVIVEAKQPVKVTSQKAILKVGLKGQEAGKITITETEKEMIKRGKDIEIVVPFQNGIEFTAIPEIKVTSGDLQLGKAELKDVQDTNNRVIGKKLVIPVVRASKNASTIEIQNFKMTVDRTVAEGAYDVTVGGEALTANGDSIKVEDFITIGTANTEDLMGANGLAKGTSTFVINESKYTVNGVEKTMDAASYIQDPGYTMVPVRYVAEAFGIEGNDILFSNGAVTIFAGSRTIQLTNNSDIAVVNGVQIKMATKVAINDGRTYAPIGEVAQLLGIEREWDNTTKTAKFVNR